MNARFLVVPALACFMAMGCTGGSSSSSSSSSSSTGGGPADCSTRPANHAVDTTTPTKAAVDAVTTADFVLTSGTAKAGKYCTNADNHAYYWKLPGAFTTTNNFHLVVTFDRGTVADDVDFDVVSYDAAGTSQSNAASCGATAGTNEDCMGTFSTAGTDVYVKTDHRVSNEAFSITLTKT